MSTAPGDAAAAAVDALSSLGFTALEAEAYTWLLGEPGATGYRIAQGIGKPVANTYKALESLHKKGAVIVDEDESRTCRAVPAAELLAQLERGFAASRAAAERALAQVGDTVDADDRVYRLRTPAQALERARAMLRRARTVVLVDAFPGAIAAVRAEIAAAGRRGVEVAVKAYAPIELAGAELFVSDDGAATLERWPGEWLNLVVDGTEHLMAFFAEGLGHLHQAVWSGSPYLSWVYHSALAAELVMAEVRTLAAQAERHDRLRKAIARLDRLLHPEAAGDQALARRFGLDRPVARKKKESSR